MNYAKVENGQAIQIGLPSTGTLQDGSTVSGYNLLPENILLEEGWLPLVDNKPEYDAETEYLEHTGYTIGETEVVVNYTVKTIVITPPQPTLEEQNRADIDYLAIMTGVDLNV